MDSDPDLDSVESDPTRVVLVVLFVYLLRMSIKEDCKFANRIYLLFIYFAIKKIKIQSEKDMSCIC